MTRRDITVILYNEMRHAIVWFRSLSHHIACQSELQCVCLHLHLSKHVFATRARVRVYQSRGGISAKAQTSLDLVHKTMFCERFMGVPQKPCDNSIAARQRSCDIVQHRRRCGSPRHLRLRGRPDLGHLRRAGEDCAEQEAELARVQAC